MVNIITVTNTINKDRLLNSLNNSINKDFTWNIFINNVDADQYNRISEYIMDNASGYGIRIHFLNPSSLGNIRKESIVQTMRYTNPDDYSIILDWDDSVEPEYLNKVNEVIESGKDVYFLKSFHSVNYSGISDVIYQFLDEFRYDNLLEMYKHHKLYQYIWGHVYKNKFLLEKSLYFSDVSCFEECTFWYKVLEGLTSFGYIDFPGVSHFHDLTSASNYVDDSKYIALNKSMEDLSKVDKEFSESKKDNLLNYLNSKGR